MMQFRFSRIFAMALAIAAALAVTGCGRRGPPEAPPSATVLSTDEQGQVVEEAAPPPDRPFILDPLIQ